jgi:hypothetical protein
MAGGEGGARGHHVFHCGLSTGSTLEPSLVHTGHTLVQIGPGDFPEAVGGQGVEAGSGGRYHAAHLFSLP